MYHGDRTMFTTRSKQSDGLCVELSNLIATRATT
jgi:hypothetical protein